MSAPLMPDDRLSAALRDFARALGADFAVPEILEHMVECIVGVLPVRGLGVTLLSCGGAADQVTASDEAALRLAGLQTDLGEGPGAYWPT